MVPSGSKDIPINRYHENHLSQMSVVAEHGSDWRSGLQEFYPNPSRILRLIKNPQFTWQPNTTEILGVLQRIPPHVPPSVYQQMRDALRGFHDAGPGSATKESTHDKRSGTSKPVPHIGVWAKGSGRRDGKPPGEPWVTADTKAQQGVALAYLIIICNLLRDYFNGVIMDILKVEDPRLWWRMQLYVS